MQVRADVLLRAEPSGKMGVQPFDFGDASGSEGMVESQVVLPPVPCLPQLLDPSLKFEAQDEVQKLAEFDIGSAASEAEASGQDWESFDAFLDPVCPLQKTASD